MIAELLPLPLGDDFANHRYDGGWVKSLLVDRQADAVDLDVDR